MNISLELGIRIRYYRKEKHMTQEKLAEICNLHPTYIGQIERGEKMLPSKAFTELLWD